MARIPREVFRNIRRIQITTTHVVDALLAGAYRSAFKGQGMEFEEVRAYNPGDEIRSIDWNVTARMQFPYIKRFREERELTVMLVVDISGSQAFGSGHKSKSELIAELGALLAFSAIKNNDKVGLLLFSDQVEQYLPPAKGVSHVLRVIRELLVSKPKGRGTDVAGALQYLSKVQKKRGVCFLLSDFLCRPFTDSLNITSKRHDLIGIGIRDPMEMVFPNLDLVTLEDLEGGGVEQIVADQASCARFASTAQMQYLECKDAFRRASTEFIDLRTDRDYVHALHEFFRRREVRR